MHFQKHLELAGKHAYLSASKYHWANYDDEKFDISYKNALAAMRGTELHDLAYRCIKLGVKLPRTTATINAYVNDAIGYKMVPEQILYYSDNSFGTADTISFRKNLLRIHDLKTGVSTASFKQLEIYVALFCLEYGIKPGTISVELRIYQNDDVAIHVPELDDILHIMGTIIKFDNRINELKLEAFGS